MIDIVIDVDVTVTSMTSISVTSASSSQCQIVFLVRKAQIVGSVAVSQHCNIQRALLFFCMEFTQADWMSRLVFTRKPVHAMCINFTPVTIC